MPQNHKTKRQKQVGKLIQAELSEIFQRTGLNITQGGMLSISKVSMTPDLIEARVYLSLFQIPDGKKVLAELKERNWEYRKMLGERVRHQLRRVPYIEFFIDDTLDYVFKMEEVFKNKVAESGIITLDLEDYLPSEEIALFDMKDYLFMELILKEKDFRESLKQLDTSIYKDKITAITCTADAIIPMWAYMLVASILQPVAREIIFGNADEAKKEILLKNIRQINTYDYTDKRIVIKGCGEQPIPQEAYIEITKLLRPVAKSIMYGEPCSTVPVFKKEKIVP